MLLVAACNGVQRPSNDQFVSQALGVKSPFFNDHAGSLQLIKDGYWAYFPATPEHALDATPGGLLALGDSEDTFRHLYRVSQIASWGLILERLDTDPLQMRSQANLIVLGPADAAQMDRWNFCAGNTPITSETCINRYPPGTTFRVFEKGPQKDIFPDALFRVGDPDSVLGELPSDWIAVPLGHTHPRSASRVLIRGCDFSFPRIGTVTADFTPPQTPLEVEDTAFDFGVDAILNCDGETLNIWTPGILRARVHALRERMVTTPIASAHAIEITIAKAHHGRVAAAFAALGAGDFHATSFHAAQLARLPDHGADVALKMLAEISASTGEIEIALKLATLGTRGMWNPETDVAWNIAQARVEDALGDVGTAGERWLALGKRAQAQHDDSSMGWLLWNEFRQRHQKGTERYQDILSSASGPLSHWRTVILVWLALVDNADSLSVIAPAQLAPASHLIDSETKTAKTLLPSSVPSILDVYGQLSKGASGPQLARMGYSQFIPGLRYQTSNDILITTAMTRFFPEAQRDLAPLVLKQMNTHCPNLWVATHAEVLSHTPQNEAIWAITHLLEPACKSFDALLALNVPAANMAEYAQIVDAIVAKDPMNTEALGRIAKLEGVPAEICQRWRLAHAANLLVSGQLNSASESLRAAESCKSDVYTDSAIGLSLMVEFELTVRLRIVDNSGVRQNLAQALGQAAKGCVGTQPLVHDVRPVLHVDLLPYIPQTIILSRNSPGELVQASELLAEAAQDLDAVRQKIAKNDLTTVYEDLRSFESAFRRLGHQPGLARVQWLQSHFGSPPTARVPKYEVLTQPKKAATRSEELAWLVDYLARGEDALQERRTAVGPPGLCTLAPVSTEPMIIE